MTEITILFTGSAFLAGLLMFFAPCTLPLIPAYLAYISGLNPRQLEVAQRHRLISNAVWFTLGFSVVFIGFGIVAGLFGALVGPWRTILSQLGGVLIIGFGLMMLGVIRLDVLSRSHRFVLPQRLAPGTPLGAIAIGSTFALGWTPCVGPILATVLLLASTEATIATGALMLTVFSLGFALPFLLTAFLYEWVEPLLLRHQGVARLINLLGGGFMLLIGGLLIFDQFGLTVTYGYRLFEALGFEGFFERL